MARRGLRTYSNRRSRWHGKIRVQDSSVAFEGPCCFVFTQLAYSNTPSVNPPHLHLNRVDAERLRDGLTKFLESSNGQA